MSEKIYDMVTLETIEKRIRSAIWITVSMDR